MLLHMVLDPGLTVVSKSRDHFKMISNTVAMFGFVVPLRIHR